jgi:hypothetical protein
MERCVRAGRGAASALTVVVVLTAFTSHPAGKIVIDNDVTIDWTQSNLTASATIVGGPQLVRDWNSVRLIVDFQKDVVGFEFADLQAAVYPLDLCSKPIANLPCPLSARAHITSRPSEEGIPLTDFVTGNGGNLPNQLNNPSIPLTPGILVISGRIHTGAAFPGARITVSGEVSPVIIDRIGDVGLVPRNAVDVPARSSEMVRALNQIETGLFPKPAVDLDTAVPRNADVAVGYTHLFDFPLDANGAPIQRIQAATVTLRLTNPHGSFSSDFILLDRAVADLARGRPPVTVIPLRHLSRSPVPGSDATFDFTIDLACVPTGVLSNGHPFLAPPEWLDLTRDLRDRRLNVIVVGDSTVDLSDLTVVFQD